MATPATRPPLPAPVKRTPHTTTFRVVGSSTPQRVRMGWGQVIQTARLGMSYSRRELAYIAQCSPTTLARIEQGYHTNSRSGGWTSIYRRLFKALGMELCVR